MLKRIVAGSVLALLVTAPVWALNDGVNFNPVPERPNWLAREADVNALDGKITVVENSLTQRLAMMEQRVAMMEKSNSERVSNLRREIQDLRASLDTQKENGERKTLGKANGQTQKNGQQTQNGQNGRLSQDRLNALNERVAELERSLTETVNKVKDIRSRMQDLNQARAASRGRPAQLTRGDTNLQ
jgi:chromosome segregation ATPase